MYAFIYFEAECLHQNCNSSILASPSGDLPQKPPVSLHQLLGLEAYAIMPVLFLISAFHLNYEISSLASMYSGI